MTYEKALNDDIKLTPIQARNDLERYLLRDEKPIYKAVAMGMQALEKQIPKKIETQTEDDREFIDYICPCCRTTLQQLIKSCYSQRYFKNTVYKYKYCLHCGQALDWSDTERKQDTE